MTVQKRWHFIFVTKKMDHTFFFLNKYIILVFLFLFLLNLCISLFEFPSRRQSINNKKNNPQGIHSSLLCFSRLVRICYAHCANNILWNWLLYTDSLLFFLISLYKRLAVSFCAWTVASLPSDTFTEICNFLGYCAIITFVVAFCWCFSPGY